MRRKVTRIVLARLKTKKQFSSIHDVLGGRASPATRQRSPQSAQRFLRSSLTIVQITPLQPNCVHAVVISGVSPRPPNGLPLESRGAPELWQGMLADCI